MHPSGAGDLGFGALNQHAVTMATQLFEVFAPPPSFLPPLALTPSPPLQHRNVLFEALSRIQVKPSAISGPVLRRGHGSVQRCVPHLCLRHKKYEPV